MTAMKVLSVFALIGSIAWMVADPNFEPALAIVASLSALIADFLVEKRKGKAFTQYQTVSGNGVSIQAGGDVKIGDIGSKGEEI